MFPSVQAAVARIMPPNTLRWICFGHFEADECGAMNEWLAVAPHAEVAHGQTACLVSLNDMADRQPRILADGEVIDLGAGKRVRYIDTPHIPHGWEAGVVYEEATSSFKSTAISAAAKCPLHILYAAVAAVGGVSGDR
jgi:flavorubredoxin